MKSVLATLLLIFSVSLYAQKDVTQFLGIPVDGSKSEMIKKLKAKGFRDDPTSEALLGEFNGGNVNVFVTTNNNKVCRIVVCDAHTVNGTDIRIRFNRLCEQFSNNAKYLSVKDCTIPDEEDIDYEIMVNKKRYEAVFYQKPVITDSIAIANNFRSILSSKYTDEQLANPTEDLQKDIVKLSTDYVIEQCVKKPVWFTVSDYCGEYYITIFYDNEYNRANGEDL